MQNFVIRFINKYIKNNTKYCSVAYQQLVGKCFISTLEAKLIPETDSGGICCKAVTRTVLMHTLEDFQTYFATKSYIF